MIPPVIRVNNQGKFIIIDGNHRIATCYKNHIPSIPVIVLNEELEQLENIKAANRC